MARWRSKRNRKRKRGDRSETDREALAIRNASTRRSAVQLRPEPLEVIAGHDGLLRGKPEPVVVAAVYACTPDGSALISRILVQYTVEEDAPTWAQPRKRTQPNPVRFETTDTTTLVLLVIAMEQDAGSDIAALYGGTDRVDDLLVWPLQGHDAIPRPLAEVRDWIAAEASLQVGLHTADGPPIDTFRRDDYVGTAVTWLAEPGRRRTTEIALPIRSRDGRNHWVVNLRAAVR